MRICNTIKKLSATIMAFAMLLSVFTLSDNKITAKAAGSPVKMYCCDLEGSYRGSLLYNVYIKIDASSAGSKSVFVRHSTYGGGWEDTAAVFVTKLDANTEIWKATISGTNVGQYSIKYIGDGQTYLDDNNGNNYTCYEPLGETNVKVVRPYYQNPASYYIRVAVKNLAYNKVVKVRYTQDNWSTWQDVNLSYQYVESGNTNTEYWSCVLNLDETKMDSFHYCVSYEVNNQTYWDNNFNSNYDQNFYMAY